MLKVKNGTVYYNWVDLAEERVFDWIGRSNKGYVLLQPTKMEEEKIVTESDIQEVADYYGLTEDQREFYREELEKEYREAVYDDYLPNAKVDELDF